jgi:hypothetical protein
MEMRGVIKLFKHAIAAVFATTALLGCSATAQKQQDLSERQKIAMAMFQERCKKAGEFVYRTVGNVEGIYLQKIRTTTNFNDQFRLDDPYGHDSTNDEYLMNFLRGFHHQGPTTATQGVGFPPRKGYLYVEAVDPKDDRRYRYTGHLEEPWQTNKAYLKGYTRFVLHKVLAPSAAPRYGVTFNDISTHEEREYWVAGSSLKVVDLQTNEVIGERIGYMVDWAQGSTTGGRSPWLFAADNACPDFNRNRVRRVPGPAFSAQAGQTLDFVEKVLTPSK